MNKKLCLCLWLFACGLVMFSGCTPYMKGSRQLESKDYDAAIESFREELSQNPDNWRARRQLGYALIKTGQMDRAIYEFKTVLGHDPQAYPYSTAFSYAPQKFKPMSGQKPKDPLSTYYLGLAYLHKDQRSEAIETWRSYRDSQRPMVEKEIKKQITLVQIADSIKNARQALAEEEKLKTLPPKPGTVAVFYFKDVSTDNSLRHFQKAMATMITSDLSQVKSLLVLERARVQFLLTEMELGQTGIVDQNTAPRAGRLLGAENLIVGTMEPRSLHVKANVASTESKDVVGTVAVGAELDEFYILEKEIVYNILKLLHVEFTPEEEEKFSQYHTKNLQAVVYFGQGLEALDLGKWETAKAFFDQAVEEDSEFELARQYRDACPAATAPTSSQLGNMSTEELANLAEHSIENISEVEAAYAVSNFVGTSIEKESKSGPNTGDITFSW